MKKRMLITLAALLIVFGGIFGWKAVQNYFMNRYFSTFQPPPASVSAATAEVESWQPTLESVGSVAAVNGVDVSTEVSGIVRKIGFDSGQYVRRDHLLIQLDDNSDQADLHGLTARLELARGNFTRSQSLLEKGFVSQANVDQTRSELDSALAAVAAKQALIAKKAIRAPFAGRLGIRKVNLGQYVAPGASLVTLQSVNPVYVNFSMPAQALNQARTGQTVHVSVDSFPGRTFDGKVTAIDSRIDDQTRNVLIQATLSNPGGALQPGMYANVSLLLPQQEQVVSVPKTAVSYSPFGDYVYVIQSSGKDESGKPQLTVKQVFVVTGAQKDEKVGIVKGLSKGDRVVTAGQLKLRNGAHVKIEDGDRLAPAAEATDRKP